MKMLHNVSSEGRRKIPFFTLLMRIRLLSGLPWNSSSPGGRRRRLKKSRRLGFFVGMSCAPVEWHSAGG